MSEKKVTAKRFRSATEKEIEKFKPSGWLYVFLFIYYSVWLLQGFGVISHYCAFGFDEFQKYGLTEWLFFPVYLIAAFYSLYAVIKTLRGDADCITALKWSLVIVFLYTGFDQTRGQIATYNVWVWCAVFFARPLFYLIFYLYLCFAKGVKRRYPKEDSRFAPSGWVWVGILMLFLAIAVFAGVKQHKISQYCRKVGISQLNLQSGEISDGYIIFNSDREWTAWLQPADTLWIDERIETLPTLMSVDSISMMYLASGQCHKPDARTHNQIIVASLSILRQNEIRGDLREVSFSDTIINGNKLMSTSFELNNDSTNVHFTVMNITDRISPKCGVFVRIDKRGYEPRWAVEFAKGVRFDLKNIAEGKNDESGNNAKHSQAYRIGNRYDQPYANLLATLNKSRLPCFFFGVMHAKNREREIAESKCYYIINYL